MEWGQQVLGDSKGISISHEHHDARSTRRPMAGSWKSCLMAPSGTFRYGYPWRWRKRGRRIRRRRLCARRAGPTNSPRPSSRLASAYRSRPCAIRSRASVRRAVRPARCSKLVEMAPQVAFAALGAQRRRTEADPFPGGRFYAGPRETAARSTDKAGFRNGGCSPHAPANTSSGFWPGAGVECDRLDF